MNWGNSVRPSFKPNQIQASRHNRPVSLEAPPAADDGHLGCMSSRFPSPADDQVACSNRRNPHRHALLTALK